MIAARQTMWGGRAVRRVEYLESAVGSSNTAGPFIIVGPGYRDVPTAVMELDMQIVGSGGTYGSANTNKWMFGRYYSSACVFGISAGSTVLYFCGGGTGQNNDYRVALATSTTWARHTYVSDGPRDGFYLDGVRKGGETKGPATIWSGMTAAQQASIGKMCLFGRQDHHNCRVRVFGYRAWVGGQPYCDLVPVRVGDAPYMYDRVTRTLLGSTTGALLCGPAARGGG